MKPWLKKLLIEGRIVPDTIIRSFRYKEFKEQREENVKKRYDKKRIKKENINNMYPRDMKICIDLSRIKKEKRDIGLTNVIFGIINDRLDSGKSNIYTANFTEEGLRDVLGDRLYSRILVGSKMVILRGSDHRGDKKW